MSSLLLLPLFLNKTWWHLIVRDLFSAVQDYGCAFSWITKVVGLFLLVFQNFGLISSDVNIILTKLHQGFMKIFTFDTVQGNKTLWNLIHLGKFREVKNISWVSAVSKFWDGLHRMYKFLYYCWKLNSSILNVSKQFGWMTNPFILFELAIPLLFIMSFFVDYIFIKPFLDNFV